MLSDRAALLEAIKAEPDEDTPRLAFADLLDERLDTYFADWAALIRAQVEYARQERYSDCWIALTHEQARLFTKRRNDWTQLWGSGLGPAAHRRGFLEGMPFYISQDVFPKRFSTYFASNPIRAIHLAEVGRADTETLRELLRRPELERVETLDLRNDAHRKRDRQFTLRLIAKMPRLRALGLCGSGLAASEVADIIGTLPAGRIQALDLSGNYLFVDDQRPESLFHAPTLARLHWLDLGATSMRPEALYSLAHSPVMKGLRHLDLEARFASDAHFGPEGAASLAAGTALRQLEVLNLSYQQIGTHGVAALVSSGILSSIRELDLKGNQIGDLGAALLANCPHVRNLRMLDLNQNSITMTGVEAIIDSPHLAGLQVLRLADAALGEEAARRSRERFPRQLPDSFECHAQMFEPIP
jgi:uncharacterized protein (TIGR02996 family)